MNDDCHMLELVLINPTFALSANGKHSDPLRDGLEGVVGHDANAVDFVAKLHGPAPLRHLRAQFLEVIRAQVEDRSVGKRGNPGYGLSGLDGIDLPFAMVNAPLNTV